MLKKWRSVRFIVQGDERMPAETRLARAPTEFAAFLNGNQISPGDVVVLRTDVVDPGEMVVITSVINTDRQLLTTIVRDISPQD